jgi:hypothetical protein
MAILSLSYNNKEWDCNKETMGAYVQEVRKLKANLLAWRFTMYCGSTMLARIPCPN